MKKDRIILIDIAKAITIFLVIWGHVSTGSALEKFLYSFHMPLFFVISGMFVPAMGGARFDEYRKYVHKQLGSIMFIYFIWAFIYSPFSFKNILYILYGTRETLLISGSLSSLWFLPVLFVAKNLCKILLSILPTHNKNRIVLLQLLSILICYAACHIPHYERYGLPLAIDVSCVALSFMLIGCFIKEFCIMQISNIKPCWRILVSILCICILIGSYNCNQYVLMANAQWGRIWLMYINALVGCMGILLLSSALATLPSRIVRYLIICGQMSLGIMLVHKPFCEFAKSHSSLINLSCENFYFSLVVSILIFMISIMIVKLIQKDMPFLLSYQKHELHNEN